MKRSVSTPLLVVDVQNGFVNENSRHILPVVTALVSDWLERGAPVYMSQFTNRSGSQWNRLLHWSRLSSEAEIALCPELARLSQNVTTYRKESYSCVVGPFLDDLQRASWTDVVVCGIATDGCILATVIDLFEYKARQLRPVVVSDACASHAGPEINDAGLLLIQRFIGREQVVPSRELLDGADRAHVELSA